jgi:hypothetical protein
MRSFEQRRHITDIATRSFSASSPAFYEPRKPGMSRSFRAGQALLNARSSLPDSKQVRLTYHISGRHFSFLTCVLSTKNARTNKHFLTVRIEPDWSSSKQLSDIGKSNSIPPRGTRRHLTSKLFVSRMSVRQNGSVRRLREPKWEAQ